MDNEQLDQVEAQVEQNITSKNAVEERMTNLAKAKAEAEKAKAEADARAANAEKERDFFANFSDSIAKYPSANEYKDVIKEKVMSGYTVEDATIAVLAREGKLTPPPPERQSPAGGSASNQIQSGGISGKTIQELNREEKRQAVLESIARGDISLN